MKTATDVRVISLPQAARMLGVSWHRAYRLVLIGTLEAQLVDGRYRIKRRSVTDLRRIRERERAECHPASTPAGKELSQA